MQAVILAAGKSTRTYPLTLTRPKPLLKVANKEILAHNIDNLTGLVDEIILVVGFKGNMIMNFVKKTYPKLNVKYITQKKQLGTGHAVSILEKHIKGKFLLLMGDNIYSKKDISKISKYRFSILLTKVNNPENYGVVKVINNTLIDVFEKPKKFISNLVSCALYSLDREIFTYLKNTKKSERGEIELTDVLKKLSLDENIRCVETSDCIQISYPWNLLKADKKIRNKKNSIGKNSIIKGSIINSSIGDNCKILGKIKNSIIMDNSSISKDSIIEDSVIAEKVTFDGIIKSKNNVLSIVKGKRIEAGRLGAIIGDNVKTKDAKISPGVKIWPGRNIKGNIRNDMD